MILSKLLDSAVHNETHGHGRQQCAATAMMHARPPANPLCAATRTAQGARATLRAVAAHHRSGRERHTTPQACERPAAMGGWTSCCLCAARSRPLSRAQVPWRRCCEGIAVHTYAAHTLYTHRGQQQAAAAACPCPPPAPSWLLTSQAPALVATPRRRAPPPAGSSCRRWSAVRAVHLRVLLAPQPTSSCSGRAGCWHHQTLDAAPPRGQAARRRRMHACVRLGGGRSHPAPPQRRHRIITTIPHNNNEPRVPSAAHPHAHQHTTNTRTLAQLLSGHTNDAPRRYT